MTITDRLGVAMIESRFLQIKSHDRCKMLSLCCDSKRRGIAQLVESRSPKPSVVGSSPTAPAVVY